MECDITAKSFAVDHGIPFALWGNNDLWNVLHAPLQANGEKSDKLPATVLLQERRVEICATGRSPPNALRYRLVRFPPGHQI